VYAAPPDPLPRPPPKSPEVHQVLPAEGPVFGETTLTITGKFFGLTPGATVLVGGQPCKGSVSH
jgi:hypothetical protein